MTREEYKLLRSKFLGIDTYDGSHDWCSDFEDGQIAAIDKCIYILDEIWYNALDERKD